MKNDYKNIVIKIIWFISFFYYFSIISCNSPIEESNSIFVDSYVDTTNVNIGDILKYNVLVSGGSDYTVRFPELIVNEPLEIREKHIDSKLNKVEFQIVFWDTGYITIPSYSIQIESLKDSTVKYFLDTDSISIRVNSILNNNIEKSIKDIKEPVPVIYPIRWRIIGQWLFLGIMTFLLLFFWKQRKIYHSFKPIKYHQIKTPYSRAIERIESLKDELDDKSFYVDLSYLIREFIEYSIFVKTLEMTTNEIKANRKLIKIDDSFFNQLINILYRADEIKYAKESTTQKQRKNDIVWCQNFFSWAKNHW